MGGGFGQDLERSNQLGTVGKSTSRGSDVQRYALSLKGIRN